jgi:hypothetical protein
MIHDGSAPQPRGGKDLGPARRYDSVESVSVHRRDGKSGRATGVPAPTVKTVIGVPNLPVYAPPLDLDMEELSGSLLIEEPPGRGAEIGSTTLPAPGAAAAPIPTASSSAPPVTVPLPPLPMPSLPPRHDTPARPSQPRPPDAVQSEPLLVETLDALPPDTASVPTSSFPMPPTEPFDALAQAETRSPSADVEIARRANGVTESIGNALKRWFRKPSLAALGVAGVGALIGVGLLGVTVLLRHHAVPPASVRETAKTSEPALAPASVPSVGAGPVAAASTACAVAGAARVIAPSALVTAGIEARAFGDEIALGFAPSDHQAMLVRLDPSSLSASESTTVHSEPTVRRVTPVPGIKGRLGLAVDADRKTDPLQGRRTLPLDPPVQVGVAGGALAWAPWEGAVQGRLWPIDGDGAVDALRGARSESNLSAVAIAFRHGGAIWIGAAERSATLLPKGRLSRIATGASATGVPSVGSPAIAFNDGMVITAWAERSGPPDPWRIGWARVKAGEAASEPSLFTPPAGGKGGETMSPGLSVVPGGRFLLVWTEGPPAGHEVRALTLSAEGTPIGRPLRISNGSTNAGQGQVAMTSKGRGVVAFLEALGSGFRLTATPIVCGEQ